MTATGLLAEWNVEPRLGEIAVPTLILSGRYDEATPAQQKKNFGGARYGWKMMGGKLVDLLGRIP